MPLIVPHTENLLALFMPLPYSFSPPPHSEARARLQGKPTLLFLLSISSASHTFSVNSGQNNYKSTYPLVSLFLDLFRNFYRDSELKRDRAGTHRAEQRERENE